MTNTPGCLLTNPAATTVEKMAANTGIPREPSLPQTPRDLHHLSDYELDTQLTALLQQKHILDAELLIYLAELDRRKLYREQACPSLFTFCVTRLGMSEDVAYKRVTACRLLRRFPRAYQLLRDGRIHLTGLVLLGPHLTEDNHHEWFFLAVGKSKRELEKLLATRYPEPAAPTSMRKLPEPRHRTQGFEPAEQSQTAPAVAFAAPSESAPAVAFAAPSESAPAVANTAISETAPATFSTELPTILTAPPVFATSKSSVSQSSIAPLSGTTYRVTFTATESLKVKMDYARDLASHAVQPSNLPALIERAFDLLIESEERRRCGKSTRKGRPATPDTATPDTVNLGVQGASSLTIASTDPTAQPHSQPPPQPHSQDIGAPSTETVTETIEAQFTEQWIPVAPPDPGRVRDSETGLQKPTRNVKHIDRQEVWTRDGGQCTFVDEQGHRCPARAFLEFDHIRAHARFGSSTASNLRLRCKCHNGLEAERTFGKKKITTAIAEARRRRSERES
jgi:hypothetical protein